MFVKDIAVPGASRVDVWVQKNEAAAASSAPRGAKAQLCGKRVGRDAGLADRDHSRRATAQALVQTAISAYCGSDEAPSVDLPGDFGDASTLAVPLGDHVLQCRFSLTSGHVVLAVSEASQYGLHCTGIDRRVRWSDLATRIFSPGEVSDLLAIPLTGQSRRFMQIWSLKSAYFRGAGEGRADALESVGLTFNRSGCIRFYASEAEKGWSFAQFELPEDLLVSASLRLPAVVSNTFRFITIGEDGNARLQRPLVFRRSQPIYMAATA